MSVSFFNVVFANHDACRRDTDAYIRTDTELSSVFSGLDVALAALDRVASCTGSCEGGDHVLEKLLTRCVSTSASAWRLTEIGHYDEAMSLIRSLGELTNLLTLFAKTPKNFARWKSLTYKDRRREFDPAPVRRSLGIAQAQIWMDDNRYGELCEKSVHAVPHLNPQVFDVSHRPSSGACFQPNGLAQCVFELALQVSGILIAAASLKQTAQHLNEVGEVLLRKVPGVSVLSDSPAS